MMRQTLLLGLVFLSGCTAVPAKVSVTDVGSDKTFETYAGEPYAKENMLGYNFLDLKTGQMVMLKSYTSKVIEPAKIVWWGSPDEAAFKDTLRAGK